MNRPIAKYILTIGVEVLEVSPVNASDLSVSIQRNQALFRNYERSIDEPIILGDDAYQLIDALTEEDVATLQVKLYTDDYTDDYVQLKFNRFNCEFIQQNSLVKITAKGASIVSEIIELWDVEHNIIEIESFTESFADVKSTLEYQAYFNPLGTPPDTVEGEYKIVGTNGFYVLYARERSVKPDSSAGWVYITDAYYRNFDYAFPALGSNVSITPQAGYVAVYYYKLEGVTIHTYYADYAYINSVGYQIEYFNGRKLKDVFQFLLDKLNLSLDIKSTFFFNDVKEDGSDSDANYVTSDVLGVPTANKLNNIALHQNSDVKRPTATENATVARLSLKKLINDLSVMFDDIVCFIDSHGDFRVEHIFYFENVNGVDYTQIFNKKGVSYIVNQTSYVYAETNIPRFIDSKMIYQLSNENKGIPLELVSFAVSETVPKTTAVLTSDLQGINDNIEQAPDEGITILQRDIDDIVENEVNDLTGVVATNGHLSVPNLQNLYHRHNKPVSKLIINNNAVGARTLKKIKEQEELNVPFVSDFDENKLLKSEMGWGELKEGALSLKSGFINIKLLQS